MQNTWFTDIVRLANERILSEGELARVMAYYATLPARLKLSEELERLEPTLVKPLHADLLKRYPDRPVYSRRLVQDVVEGLRHVARAVVADELRLLRRRWTDHLLAAVAATDTDPVVVRDAYVVLREHLERQLPRSAWDVFEPAYDDLLDALSRGPAA